jgi:tetratricopeptide (TPR) repeat protein
MDLVLRGDVAGRNNWTLTQALEQRKFYEQALQTDPDFVPPLVRPHSRSIGNWSRIARWTMCMLPKKMDSLTSRAIAIDPMDSRAWGARNAALEALGRWDEALSANARAQALESSNSGFVLDRAYIMIHTGQPGEH